MCGEYPVLNASACSVPCRFSTESSDFGHADVVIVHLPTAPAAALTELEKLPGQTWVAWSMESEVTSSLIRDVEVMSRFDLEVSYRRSADVWCPYFGRYSVETVLAPAQAKTEPYPVACFQSNPYDASGRSRLASELIRRIKVASYGRVLPTVPDPGAIATRAGRLAVCARHKFTLAFENSIAPDHVTDKIFDVWEAGSVPVYLGAPNVSEFAPAAHSYIDVTSFDGPADLADYLNHLDGNDEEYAAYLEWKRSGPDASFRELTASVSDRPWCEVVELAHAKRHARSA
jgi:alpha-1,3-fucosyltransferase 10